MGSKSTNTDNESLPIASLRLLAPPLRLVSAAMWKVMQQRDVVHYGMLEEFVKSVSETVPRLLSYRHQAKLTIGLRARLILEQLRVAQSSEPDLILPQLEKLCVPAISNNKRMRIDQKVEMAVKNFHTLVQTLLEKPAVREQFFKEDFVSQYGPQYDSALENLLWEFLIRLDQLLPVPDLAQTVSWLTGTPAVLEECARSASQPQLLRTLLQHEKCLGHLKSAVSVPSSIGDSILSSLSLPLSGKVPDSNKTGSTPTPKMHQSLNSSGQKSIERHASRPVSHIAPIIGSISMVDIPHGDSTGQNGASISEMKISEEAVPEVYEYTSKRCKSGSCQKRKILEKVPDEKNCVGKLLLTVINQTPTSSEVEEEEEEESLVRPKRSRSRRQCGVKDKLEPGSGYKMMDLGRKRKRDGSKTPRNNSWDTKGLEEETLHADDGTSIKHQLGVASDSTQTVLRNNRTDKALDATTLGEPAVDGTSIVRNVSAMNIKISLRNSQDTEPQKNAGLHADIETVKKRQLRVIIPRLKITNSTQKVSNKTNKELSTASPGEPATEDMSAVKNISAVNQIRKSSRRNLQDTKPQEEEGLHSDLPVCINHHLRVSIPRLELPPTFSKLPATRGMSAERNVDTGNLKQKLCLSATPEKNLIGRNDEEVYAGSPCIPKLTPLRMEHSDAVSTVIDSTDDIIVDSEDEATEKFKGRLFTKRYCKTKTDTYIPTLHEFWTPVFRRDVLSPGNGCR